MTAALSDSDPIVRAGAVRHLTGNPNSDYVVNVLDSLVKNDRSPAIRKLALALLIDRAPNRAEDVARVSLLDRAASVRAVAQFIVRTRNLPIALTNFYRAHLADDMPSRLAAAIIGIGDTGTPADLEQLTPFLNAPSAQIRAAALRAHGRLDIDGAIRLAIEALGDDAPCVQRAAVVLLIAFAPRVNVELVHQRMRSLTAARARQRSIRVLAAAPKWDAAAYLLDALNDPDSAVRATALRHLGVWLDRFNRSQPPVKAEQLQHIEHLLRGVESRMPAEMLKLLRFSFRTQ